MLKIFKCNVCGNIVILTVEGGGKLVCCGQDMTLLEPNTSEGAGEKHLPDVTVKGTRCS